MKQQTLALATDLNADFERFRRTTRSDRFVATMERIVPWSELCDAIEPFYPKLGNGRPPVGLDRMLRMHFVQHRFNLADQAREEALLDSSALRRFVGIDSNRDRVPDGTALLTFRRLLGQHGLGAGLFAKLGTAWRTRSISSNGARRCRSGPFQRSWQGSAVGLPGMLRAVDDVAGAGDAFPHRGAGFPARRRRGGASAGWRSRGLPGNKSRESSPRSAFDGPQGSASFTRRLGFRPRRLALNDRGEQEGGRCHAAPTVWPRQSITRTESRSREDP